MELPGGGGDAGTDARGEVGGDAGAGEDFPQPENIAKTSSHATTQIAFIYSYERYLLPEKNGIRKFN